MDDKADAAEGLVGALMKRADDEWFHATRGDEVVTDMSHHGGSAITQTDAAVCGLPVAMTTTPMKARRIN